ncbi:MAG: hypothetical protein ACE5NW_13695 [Acidiferrobacterales bacterium]
MCVITFMEWLEALSYIVTIVGLPGAIFFFLHEQRKHRENEEEASYQRLSDGYANLLQLALDNADLQLFGDYSQDVELTAEQQERKRVMFAVLVSLFERAYITLYEEKMNRHATRLWLSWEDYISDWCRRPNFREALPELLEGEDDDFSRHDSEAQKSPACGVVSPRAPM